MLPNNRKPYSKTKNTSVRAASSADAAAPAVPGRRKKKLPWYKKLIRMMVPTKRDSKVDKIRKIIFDVAILIFIGSCTYLISYYGDSDHNAKFYDGVADMLGNGEVSENYPRAYLTKFASLWEMNEDIVGWLSIDGTQVNYPVVQTDDNDYYLHKDFSKADNKYGIPFADCRVDISKPSTNIPIYSHNMKDGQMFGELINYESLAYYQAHPVINFDSLYEEGKYKIVSIFLASTLPEHAPNFEYHNFIEAETDEELMSFANEVISRSLIVTGVDIQPGDQLVTLSTCTYDFKEARFAIVARRVREGEAETVDTSAAYVNPNPVMPKAWYEAKKIAALVAGVSLSPENLSLKPGESATLTATVLPNTAVNRNISWSSSDSSVASVDQSGTVTAHKSGTAVITVTTQESGFTASTTVTVGAGAITAMHFSSGGVSIPVEGSADLSGLLVVEPEGASKEGLIWSSSDASVVEVSGGLAAGKKIGTATITVTTANGISASIAVQVGTYIPVTGLSISGPSVVAPKKSVQLQAVFEPADATTRTVTWSSSDDRIATVDNTGKVTGVKEGSVRITASLYDSVNGDFTAQYAVTVSKGGTIELAASEAEIGVGKRVYIEFSASNGENVVWTVTGGDGQANISVDGSDLVIQGVKAGTVQIQGSFSDGSGAVTLTVRVTPSASSVPSSAPSSSAPDSSSSAPEQPSSSPASSQPDSSSQEGGGESQATPPPIWS
ncbi:MAG: Ig-like domain-containing protein [Oscillospiraceae bacterium]|nr:Ig-like domain-containing protein [Oscillospiraceae bacterium]